MPFTHCLASFLFRSSNIFFSLRCCCCAYQTNVFNCFATLIMSVSRQLQQPTALVSLFVVFFFCFSRSPVEWHNFVNLGVNWCNAITNSAFICLRFFFLCCARNVNRSFECWMTTCSECMLQSAFFRTEMKREKKRIHNTQNGNDFLESDTGIFQVKEENIQQHQTV